jgi:hypothetical protein
LRRPGRAEAAAAVAYPAFAGAVVCWQVFTYALKFGNLNPDLHFGSIEIAG